MESNHPSPKTAGLQPAPLPTTVYLPELNLLSRMLHRARAGVEPVRYQTRTGLHREERPAPMVAIFISANSNLHGRDFGILPNLPRHRGYAYMNTDIANLDNHRG